jgi:hypothetical protein
MIATTDRRPGYPQFIAWRAMRHRRQHPPLQERHDQAVSAASRDKIVRQKGAVAHE